MLCVKKIPIVSILLLIQVKLADHYYNYFQFTTVKINQIRKNWKSLWLRDRKSRFWDSGEGRH